MTNAIDYLEAAIRTLKTIKVDDEHDNWNKMLGIRLALEAVLRTLKSQTETEEVASTEA